MSSTSKKIALLTRAAGRLYLYDPRSKRRREISNTPVHGKTLKPSAREIEAITHRQRKRPSLPLVADEWPAPGGLGGGVSFNPNDLLFQRSTSIHFQLLIPQNLGANPTADLLYMTSSNRASKGCEALVSYSQDRQYEAAFMIWDWATAEQPEGGHFVVTKPYSDLDPYKSPLEIVGIGGAPTTTFDSLDIVNVTRNDGAGWINEVFLYNYQTKLQDRLWTFAYPWPTKAVDENFWWGPIFETFPSNAQFDSAPPLGFANASMMQDDVECALTTMDSVLTEPVTNGFVTLWKQDNSGLIAKGSA